MLSTIASPMAADQLASMRRSSRRVQRALAPVAKGGAAQAQPQPGPVPQQRQQRARPGVRGNSQVQVAQHLGDGRQSLVDAATLQQVVGHAAAQLQRLVGGGPGRAPPGTARPLPCCGRRWPARPPA